MDEGFEITALKLARVVLSKHVRGRTEAARQYAEQMLAMCPQSEFEAIPPPRYKIDVKVRPFLEGDFAEVHDIQNQANPGMMSWSNHWTRMMLTKKGRRAIVAVLHDEPELAGYLIYERAKGRVLVADVSVHPKYQRCGIGRQMVNYFIDKMSNRKGPIQALVSDANMAAVMFLGGVGFAAQMIPHPHSSGDKIVEMTYNGAS